jgi:hypothetical protein
MIWKLMAFLGRCGNQQASAMLHMPLSDVTRLAIEIAGLMKEESDATRRAVHQED